MKILLLSVMILTSILISFTATAFDPALVLYMPFEEGSGAKTRDVSGNGNEGSLMGGIKWTNDGKFGKALEFNGTDSQVLIKSSASLQPAESGFTIEAWIKADPGSQQWARVVDKFYGTGYCFGRRGGDPVIGAEFGGNPNSFASTTEVFDNKWHFVALVRDIKSVEGLKISQLKIYVDGKKENEIVAPNANVKNLDTTPVRIGAGDQCCAEGPPEDVAYFYKGVIDEVRIYRKALTENEIRIDMESPASVSILEKLPVTWAGIKTN